MLKSCSYCFKVHDTKEVCPKKPKAKIDYQKKRENLSEVNQKENRFYSSTRWQKFRDDIMQDRGYRCEVCTYVFNDRRKFTVAEELHHVEYIRDAWDKRLDEDNVVCLCHEHHKLIHKNNIRDKKDLEKFIGKLKESWDKITGFFAV